MKQDMKKENKILTDILPDCIFVGMILLFFVACIVYVREVGNLSYDDAYNAQVAANFFRTGVYKVSYPNDITYYNMITTGPVMLLLSSLCYFASGGVGVLATQLPAIVYGTGCIILAYLFFQKYFQQNSKWMALLGVLLLLLCNRYILRQSLNLLGECAALFFALLTLILLQKAFCCKQKRWFVLSGFFLTLALNSKEIMIFFVIALCGSLLIDIVVWKEAQLMQGASFLAGGIAGRLCIDAFKLYQLKTLDNLLMWYLLELKNIYLQSGKTSNLHSFSFGQIIDRINYLRNVYFSCHTGTLCILVLLPIAGYFVLHFLNKTTVKYVPLLYCGVGGVSLLVYFVLLGGTGLKNGRRLSPYTSLTLIFAILSVLKIIEYLYNQTKEKKRRFITPVLLLGCVILIADIVDVQNYIDFQKSFIEGKEQAPKWNEFIKTVLEVPEESIIYVYDWDQAPQISLLTGKRFYNASPLIPEVSTEDSEEVKSLKKGIYSFLEGIVIAPEGYSSIEEYMEAYYTFRSISKKVEFDKDNSLFLKHDTVGDVGEFMKRLEENGYVFSLIKSYDQGTALYKMIKKN